MKHICYLEKKGIRLYGWINEEIGEKKPSHLTMHVDSSNIETAIKLTNEYTINRISLSPNEYKLNNLEFLSNSAFLYLEEISIGNCLIKDYSQLQNMHNLRYLVIQSGRNYTLDFESLANLEFFGGDWSKNFKSFDKLVKLRHLNIYKLKENNFNWISKLTNLEILGCVHGTFKNLHGIEKLVKLKKLDIDSARNLETLDGFDEVHSSMEFIRLHGVPKLTNADSLSKLKNLRSLQITRFKKLDSLSFLNSLNRLESIAIRSLKDKNQIVIKDNTA